MMKSGKTQYPAEFTPDGYRLAAIEHAGSLQCLYENRGFVLVAYVSGLAVECMFRAYRGRVDPEFDSRHDLYELAKVAKFAEVVPKELLATYESELTIVASRWSSNHRFRSEEALRRLLKRGHFDRRIKGDFLKENVRRMLNAVSDIVTLGDRLWT